VPVIFKLDGVVKSYGTGRPILDGISLEIHEGEFVSIIGPSGAGKTTLLRILNRLNEVDSGTVSFNGVPLGATSGAELRLQRRQIAVVFQALNLVRRSSVLTNVLIARLGYRSGLKNIFRRFSYEEEKDALEALDRLGIVDKAFARADTLSLGQQQRVAIARAFVQKPKVLLADEPISSLDPVMTKTVMDDLAAVNKKGITVIANLHQVDAAMTYSSRLIGLNKGRIVFDGPPESCTAEVVDSIYA
jgi:phosphonate transport system ATP-binding protein